MNPLLSVFIWLGLTAAGLFVSTLPRPLELGLGKFLGRVALLVPKRRQIAYDNIRRCLPELGEAGWQNLLRANYEHYGILALEILHMFSPIPGHWRRYAQKVAVMDGFDLWKRASDKGKGVLCISGHLGNWELMVAIAAIKGIPVIMATRHLKPEWLHKKMEAVRLSTGVRCAIMPRTLPMIMRGLRKGESIGFVLDQYAPPPMGLPAVFFGVKVDTLAAVGSLSQRTGAAIVPVFQRRGPDGKVRIVFEPEIDLGAAAKDPAQATQILVSRVERWIREEPAQWLWGHRRFKNVRWPDQEVRQAAA